MFFVYILYSSSYDKFYVGQTENYIFRLEQHNTSERVTYTSRFRPCSIAGCFEAGEKHAEAKSIEMQIKKLKSKKMIRQIVDVKLPDFLASHKRIY